MSKAVSGILLHPYRNTTRLPVAVTTLPTPCPYPAHTFLFTLPTLCPHPVHTLPIPTCSLCPRSAHTAHTAHTLSIPCPYLPVHPAHALPTLPTPCLLFAHTAHVAHTAHALPLCMLVPVSVHVLALCTRVCNDSIHSPIYLPVKQRCRQRKHREEILRVCS